MKKLLYLALALVLVLTLAACVKEDVTTAPDPSGTPDQSGTPEPTGDAPHTHSYSDWTVVTAATCTTDGVKQRVCSCGEKETEVIAATGHIYPTDETSVTVSDDGNSAEIDATCTACGHAEKGAYTGVLVRGGAAYRFVGGARVTIEKEILECGGVRYWVIGNVIQKCVYVPVDGCIYYFGEDSEMVCGGSNGEYDFDENGALTGTDIVLEIGGEKYEVSGSTASAHTHNYTSTVTAPTCTESGYTTHTCRCGENYIDDYVKENGHDYVDGICSICGDIERISSKGLSFRLNDDGESYSVSGIGTCTDTDIVIPASYNGKPVTSIDDYAFFHCSSLTSVTIGNGVTSIGDYAFRDCISLTGITIPDSVTSIGNYAFYNCPIETATIPAIACKYIHYQNELQNQNDKLTTVVITSGESIGRCAFLDCTGLTSVTIPDGVTSIGAAAFSGCSSLTSITIPDSVTSIGDSAFLCCSSLTSITIPDSVTSIGYDAFGSCSSLTSITIPASVTSIGGFAFSGCSSLTSITFKGTKEQWNAISKDSYWDIDTGNYTYTIHCTDGDISK